MSLYASYVRERLGDEILEWDEGFLTYRFIKDGDTDAVYVVDLYVRPDFRKTKVASNMADMVAEEAKRKGCKTLLGSVSSSAKNPTESIKVLLGYGMDFYKCNEHGIFFKKELI